MHIETFTVNPLQENSLIISDNTGECIFVDPGFFSKAEHEAVIRYVEENNLNPKYIANTHAHFDHIMGVKFIIDHFKIPFFLHHNDYFLVEQAAEHGMMFGFNLDPVPMPDSDLSSSETLQFGNTVLQVIHLPGHSPGHVLFYCEEDKTLIAGDVLFKGSIGRTDLPGGDHEALIEGIHRQILTLPDDIRVYCGHGPETSIGAERRSNPFLI